MHIYNSIDNGKSAQCINRCGSLLEKPDLGIPTRRDSSCSTQLQKSARHMNIFRNRARHMNIFRNGSATYEYQLDI